MVTGQPDWKRYAAVDVFEQTVGMYLIRDWSAKLGFYKTWVVSMDLPPGTMYDAVIYTVPLGKVLFLTDTLFSVYYAGAFGETSIFFRVKLGEIMIISDLTGQRRCAHYPLSRAQPGTEGQTLEIRGVNTSAVTLRLVWLIFAYETSSPRKKRLYRVNERQMYERGMFNDCDMEVLPGRKVKLRLYNALARMTVEARGELDERGKLGVKAGKTRDVKWWE